MQSKIFLFIIGTFIICLALLVFIRSLTYKSPPVGSQSPSTVQNIQKKAITVPLQEVNHSGISGTAVLNDEKNNKYTVVLELKSSTSSGIPAFIQKGSCGKREKIAYTLASVVKGVSSTFLEGTLLKAFSEDKYSIVVDKSKTDLSVVACGEITI